MINTGYLIDVAESPEVMVYEAKALSGKKAPKMKKNISAIIPTGPRSLADFRSRLDNMYYAHPSNTLVKGLSERRKV